LVTLFCLTVCANRTLKKSLLLNGNFGADYQPNKKLYLIDSLGRVISNSVKKGIGASEGFMPDTLDIHSNIVPVDTFKYTGNYVGISYSSDNVFLIDVTGDSLKCIFDNNDSIFMVELCMFYEDNSIDTIYIDPTKDDFHRFWYSLCTQPHNKLIIGGEHKAVRYVKS